MPRRRRIPKRRADLGPLAKLDQLRISRAIHLAFDGPCCVCWIVGGQSCAMPAGRCESWAPVLARVDVTDELLPLFAQRLPVLRRWNRL